MKLIRAEISSGGGGDDILVVRSCGWFSCEDIEFRGSGTVWSRYPSGERAPTSTELKLCALWNSAKWKTEEDTPNAKSPRD